MTKSRDGNAKGANPGTPEPIDSEVLVIDSLGVDYDELKKGLSHKQPPHPDETRDKIISRLLIGVLFLIMLPLITYLAFPSAVNDKVLEYAKWGVSVILPLFGTAIGFYFGGKSKGDSGKPGG